MLWAAILSCSAVTNLPDPFASPTPTATLTFTPTITPSPEPTATPTVTPLPKGMVLRKQAGGSTVFLDYDGGYSIEIPAGWRVTKADPKIVDVALSVPGQTNLGAAATLVPTQPTPPRTYRLVAYDTRADHSENGYVPNFNVGTFDDPVAVAMPLDMLIGVNVRNAKEYMPGIQIKQLKSSRNAHGVQIGSAEAQWPFKGAGKISIPLFEKHLYFQTDKVLVVITLYVPKSTASLVLPSFAAIQSDIQAIRP